MYQDSRKLRFQGERGHHLQRYSIDAGSLCGPGIGKFLINVEEMGGYVPDIRCIPQIQQKSNPQDHSGDQ